MLFYGARGNGVQCHFQQYLSHMKWVIFYVEETGVPGENCHDFLATSHQTATIFHRKCSIVLFLLLLVKV